MGWLILIGGLLLGMHMENFFVVAGAIIFGLAMIGSEQKERNIEEMRRRSRDDEDD